VRNQLEQHINAVHLEAMGFGRYCPKLDADVVRDFCAGLCAHEDHLKNHAQDGNEELFRALKETINSFN
jgi:hypothetical protein